MIPFYPPRYVTYKHMNSKLSVMQVTVADNRHKSNKTTLEKWDGVEMNAPVDALINTSPLSNFIVTPFVRN